MKKCIQIVVKNKYYGIKVTIYLMYAEQIVLYYL